MEVRFGTPRCSSSGRIRKRAARFVTGNYKYETGSMTGILGQLKWESLKKRRKENRLILLYKGPKDKAGERGGSVVECRTPEREVRGSRPTAAVLCP